MQRSAGNAGERGKIDRPSPKIGVSTKEVLVALGLALLCGLILKLFVLEAYFIPSPSMEGTLLRGDYVLVNKLVYGLRTPRSVPFTTLRLRSVSLPGISHPAPGDVLAFELPGALYGLPDHGSVNLVKRCVGGPGQTVEIRDGIVLVDGLRLPLSHPPREGPSGNGVEHHIEDLGPVVVPAAGSRLLLSPNTLEPWRRLIEDEGHNAAQSPDGSVLIDGQPADDYRVTKDYYFMLGDNLLDSFDSRTIGFVPEDRIIGKVFLVYWSTAMQPKRNGLGSLLASVRWFRIGTIVR
jgi:signal peptidase I